jgi:hypothetical protein
LDEAGHGGTYGEKQARSFEKATVAVFNYVLEGGCKGPRPRFSVILSVPTTGNGTTISVVEMLVSRYDSVAVLRAFNMGNRG